MRERKAGQPIRRQRLRKAGHARQLAVIYAVSLAAGQCAFSRNEKLRMAWLVSILVALISGAVGMLLGGLIANACVSWYQVPSREGQSGFFVIFVAICGGIAGLVLGLVAARAIAQIYGPGFGYELLGALGLVLLTAGVSALISRMLADVPPTIDGHELFLEVEFRFPDSSTSENPPTAEGDWSFTLASISGHKRRNYRDGTIQTTAARFEEGRWIVPTRVELFTERGRRGVTLSKRDATEVMSFLLPLPARPGIGFEQWSDWIPRQQANGQAWPSDKMSCRYRVQKVPAPN